MTRKKKSTKPKLEIVFDEKSRVEFLTGFQKRKNQRRKHAKEQLEQKIKDEHKKIRQEINDGFKHLKRTFEPLRELTEEDKIEKEEEYEDDDVKVKIVELTTNDFAAQKCLLGDNCESEDNKSESNFDESEDETKALNYIPGMEIDAKPKSKSATNKRNKNNDDVDDDDHKVKKSKISKKKANDDDVNDDDNKPANSFVKDIEFTSRKDLNRLKKTKTLNKIKKSKVFKQKERFDKVSNRKKVKRDKNNTLRSIPKHLRKKMKKQVNKYHKGRLLNKKQLVKKRKNND